MNRQETQKMEIVTKKDMQEMYEELSNGHFIMDRMENRYGISIGSSEARENFRKVWGSVGFFARSLKKTWDMDDAVGAYHSAQWALVAIVCMVNQANIEHPDVLATNWLDSFKEAA